MDDLALNTRARFDLRRMGQEGQPLAIIDHALLTPQAMVETACSASFEDPPGGYYPGLNAALPEAYVVRLTTALRPLLEQAFGLSARQPVQTSGYFALATCDPEALAPIQKIPHHDSTDPHQLAILHFLCSGPQGGTAFYRHLATGFESIDATKVATYRESYRAELEQKAEALTRHVGAETPDYQLIDQAEAAFNRILIYRSTSLHSGLLEDSTLSGDPRTGRLTANVFIRLA